MGGDLPYVHHSLATHSFKMHKFLHWAPSGDLNGSPEQSTLKISIKSRVQSASMRGNRKGQ